MTIERRTMLFSGLALLLAAASLVWLISLSKKVDDLAERVIRIQMAIDAHVRAGEGPDDDRVP